MPDFVYDATGLPTGKTDARPLSTPAGSTITAAEWNSVMQAIIDLRDAVLNGDYTGLTSNPTAPVSASGGVRFRNKAGVLEVSENGGIFRRVSHDYIHVRDYGAVGDGSTDDYTAIMLALAASWSTKLPVKFGAKAYATSQEIEIGTTHTVLKGSKSINGTNATTIKAIAPMRAVMSAGINVSCEGVGLDCNRLALTGFYMQGASYCDLSMGVVSALRDGFCLAGEVDTDHHTSGGMTLEMLRFLRATNCWVKESNFIPHTGVTCTVADGNPVVTFQGDIDLTELDLTEGSDQAANVIIKSGNTIFRGHIDSVDSATQLTLLTTGFDVAPDFDASGCEFSLSNFYHTINDTNDFRSAGAGGNGQMWLTVGCTDDYFDSINKTFMNTVSAEMVDGSTEVEFTGSIDLYAMKLRAGDFIRVGTGANKSTRMIQSIDDPTHLTVGKPFDISASGQDWAIASGDGYHECPSSDNNVNSFQGTSLWRANAACGLAFAGLYGPLVIAQQIDYNGMYAIRVGGGGPCIKGRFIRNYTEANGSGKSYFLASAQACVIDTALDLGGPASDNVDVNSEVAGVVTGFYTGSDGMEELGVDATFRIKAFAEKLYFPEVRGLMSFNGENFAAAAFASTISLSASRVIINANDTDVLAASTPTIALADAGTFVMLVGATGQNGRIILQDEDFLSGTKLKLRSNRVAIGSGDTLMLFCDGFFWYEVGREKQLLKVTASSQPIGKGQIVALQYDATAGSTQKRSATLADANGGTTLMHAVGVSPGYVFFAGTPFLVQTSGEIHVPDAEWVGGTPAVTDVGAPVYLSATPGQWTLTKPSTSGHFVVQMGNVTTGGSGLVMVQLHISPAVEVP